MNNFPNKYFKSILILLIPVLFLSIWLFPPFGMMLLILSLSLGFFINSLMIIRKHRDVYLQGRTSRFEYIRNASLELLGVLIAMILAGLLGRYIAKLATSQITNNLTQFIAEIILGLAVGAVVGIFIQRISQKLLWFSKRETE